jgi:hypothetical protein
MKMTQKKEVSLFTLQVSSSLTISRTMPLFDPDRSGPFSVSSAEWHDRAYHNTAAKLRGHSLSAKIEALQTAVPTPKTMKIDAFLERIRQARSAFTLLSDHHAHERHSRWKTYRYEERAMHQLWVRVKIGKKLKREQIVVAYDAGRFASTIKGKRGTPVRKLAKKLAKYVTLVRVDEFRTSQLCSNRCMYEGLDLGRDNREEKRHGGCTRMDCGRGR